MNDLSNLEDHVKGSIKVIESQDLSSENFHKISEDTPKPRKKYTKKNKEPVISEERTASVETANLFFMLNIFAFSKYGVPEKGEKENVEAALEQYYIEYGIVKTPAWLGLVLVMSAYTGSRLSNPDALKILTDKSSPIIKKVKPFFIKKDDGKKSHEVKNKGA